MHHPRSPSPRPSHSRASSGSVACAHVVERMTGISHLEVATLLEADAKLSPFPIPKHAESPTTYRPLFNTAKAQVSPPPAPALPVSDARHARRESRSPGQLPRLTETDDAERPGAAAAASVGVGGRVGARAPGPGPRDAAQSLLSGVVTSAATVARSCACAQLVAGCESDWVHRSAH